MKKTVFISTFICMMFASGYTSFQVTATEPKNIQLADNNLVLRDSNGAILNNSNRKSKDNLIRIIVFMGLIATGSLFWYLLRSPKSLKANFRANYNSETALLDRVSPKLRRQLLRLINDPKNC